VLDSLRNTAWAHFACHATNNVATPSRSGLLLHDDLLPVTAITGLRLADAELAYLSACTTGRSSWEHPDEAIHLAGAFQLASYRHVIGTL
jgi:CHAT domain-containing protein